MNRKQMKTKAHQVVRSHYFVLTFVCMIALLVGVLFTSPIGWSTPNTNAQETTNVLNNINTHMPVTSGQEFLPDPVKSLYTWTQSNHLSNESNDLIITISSTSAVKSVYIFLYNLVQSVQISVVLIGLCMVLLQLAIWIFLYQMIHLILCRFFLEARTYESVPLQHFYFFKAAKQWAHSCLALAQQAIYLCLWFLTVIGGFIKCYSYFCTPYILAENPTLTGKQAITLSRKMMDGHKMECFVLDLSLLGWYLLNAITLGVVGALYSNAYVTSVKTEYFAYVRGLALESSIEGSEALNDTYLYTFAEPELLATTYKSTKMDTMYVEDTQVELQGAQKYFVHFFACWVGKLKQYKIYQGVENIKHQLQHDLAAMNQKEYPSRLSPTYDKENIHLDGNLNYEKAYTFPVLVILFFVAAVMGWIFEAIIFFGPNGAIETHQLFYGPWLPLYGFIAVISLTFLAQFRKNPIVTFLESFVATILVQEAAYAILDLVFHVQLWDYSLNLLSIGASTCVEIALLYACFSMIFIYLIAPMVEFYCSREKQSTITIASVVILVAFAIEIVLKLI